MNGQTFTSIPDEAFRAIPPSRTQKAASDAAAFLSAAYDLIENNGQPIKDTKERKRQLLALLEMTMRNLAQITRDTRKMERIILEQAQREQQYHQRQTGRR